MSQTFIQRTAKLVPYPSKHSSVPALAFAYHFEPQASEALQIGSLFITIEVMAKESLASQVVDLIIKTIGEEYYNKKFDDEPSLRFEKSIGALNKQLAQLFSSHHAKSINNISATIAVISGDQLYLAQCGKAHARLYRAGKTTDLASGLNEGSSENKIFHGIAEGTIKQKDKLLFTTPALLFQFQSAKLDQIVQDHTPSSCLGIISADLAQEETKSRCAALIVEITTLESAAEEPLTSEPDTVFLGKPQTKVDEVKASAAPKLKDISSSAKSQAAKAHNWAKSSALPKLKQSSKAGWNKFWTKYVNPNPRKALIVALSILSATILAVFVLNTKAVDYRSLTSDYKGVVALIDTAEAKQTLGDKAQSSQAASAAEQQLAKITSKYTTAQIDKAISQDSSIAEQKDIHPAQLKARLSVLNDKLNGIIRLSTSTVVDFASTSKVTTKELARLDDRLYVVDTTKGALHQVDYAKNSDTVVTTSSSLKSAVSMVASPLAGSIYILTSQPSVLQYKLGGSLGPVKLSGGEWKSGNAIASYVGNIYVLSPQDNQIYRHSPTSIGFSASSSYIKRANTVSVAGASALAINGSIFVATGANNLTRFDAGIGSSEQIEGLPQKAAINDLIITDSTHILALDKDGKRLYELSIDSDKISFSRVLVPDLSSPISSYATDQVGNLYLLSNNKILESKIP